MYHYSATTPDRYQRLKTTLQTTYGKTAAQRHVELIEYASTKEPVLDVKPTNMLMYIKDLIGDSKEAFESAVLLNRLPHSVRTTLSTSSAANNEALAVEANGVMEASRCDTSINHGLGDVTRTNADARTDASAAGLSTCCCCRGPASSPGFLPGRSSVPMFYTSEVRRPSLFMQIFQMSNA